MPVLLAVVVLLGVARWRRWPVAWTALAMAALWLAAIAVLAAAPESGAARAIGGRVQHWIVAGGVLAVAWGYLALVGRARRGARPLPPVARPGLNDAELDRYARHIVLRELGGAGQRRLREARVLIVGAGGLGAPSCLYLAAAGVGRITVADDDVVSLSNLQRQVIFRTRDAGRAKAEAAAAAMDALNPHVGVTALTRRITAADAALVAQHDLVLDGTDSFAAREAVNRACVLARVPLIAGSIAQWEGQVTIYDPASGAPCLACIFPQPPAPGLAPACAEAGVVGPLPGVVGSLMALEAIKALTGAGEGLRGRMLIFDGLHGETRTVGLHRNPACPVCGRASTATGPASA